MLKLYKIEDDHNINLTNNIIDFKNPTYIYIPIDENSTYKINDYIYKNTYFGEYISSISGYITGTRKVLINQKKLDALEVENDFQENILSKKKLKRIENKELLLDSLKEYNLTKTVDKILSFKRIDNLVITCIDEEQYSLHEFLRLSNNYEEVLETTDYLINLFKLNNCILINKSTNSKSIKNVKSQLGRYPNIKTLLVPDKYLIGYKDFLCEYLNLNTENTLILTTNEVYDIYNIIKKGKDITEKLITISGDALCECLNINIRLNTSLKEIIEEFAKLNTDNYEVYVNGYLNGYKISNLNDFIISKDVHTIVINKADNEEYLECINCGACQKICPYNINVKKCYYNKVNHKKCIGCGLCNFICLAKINLKDIVMSDNNEKI